MDYKTKLGMVQRISDTISRRHDANTDDHLTTWQDRDLAHGMALLCDVLHDHATRLDKLHDYIADHARALSDHNTRLDHLEAAVEHIENSGATSYNVGLSAKMATVKHRVDMLQSDSDAHQLWLADLHDTVQSITDLANRVGAIEAEREATGRREGKPLKWSCDCPNYEVWLWKQERCQWCKAYRPRLAGES